MGGEMGGRMDIRVGCGGMGGGIFRVVKVKTKGFIKPLALGRMGGRCMRCIRYGRIGGRRVWV